MADTISRRPFDDFRVAISDRGYFVGREGCLKSVGRAPFEVRFLLGGRRAGKSSTLRAVERRFLTTSNGSSGALPVFIDLQFHQPDSLGSLRYRMNKQLGIAIRAWARAGGRKTEGAYREYSELVRIMMGRESSTTITTGILKVKILSRKRQLEHDEFIAAFRRQVIRLRRREFKGVCFLFDGAEHIVGQSWADDAWSYFRGLKEDLEFGSSLGLVLSGYRSVKEFQQRVGSPLSTIAAPLEWIGPLEKAEILELVSCRCEREGGSLSAADIEAVVEWGGGHPYLTQQMVSLLLDRRKFGDTGQAVKLMQSMQDRHRADFIKWWNRDGRSDGLGKTERLVYKELCKRRKATAEVVARATRVSRRRAGDALEILVGTGVIRGYRGGVYTVGARLFEDWVKHGVGGGGAEPSG